MGFGGGAGAGASPPGTGARVVGLLGRGARLVVPLVERSRGFGSDLRWSPDKEGDEKLDFVRGGEAGAE